MAHGCKATLESLRHATRFETEGASMLLAMRPNGPTADWPQEWKPFYTGWFLVTSNASVEEDAVRFILEGSDDNESWELMGSSDAWTHDTVFEYSTLPYDTPLGRGELVPFTVLYTHTTIYTFAIWNALGFMLLALFLLAHLNLARHTRFAMAVGFGVMALLALLCSVQSFSQQQHKVGVYWVVQGVVHVICGVSFGYGLRMFDFWALFSGTLLVGDQVFLYTIAHDSAGAFGHFNNLELVAVAAWLALIGLSFIVYQLVYGSGQVIRADKLVYQNIWKDLLAREGDQVHRLHHYVRKLRKAIGVQGARQFNRQGVIEDMNEHSVGRRVSLQMPKLGMSRKDVKPNTLSPPSPDVENCEQAPPEHDKFVEVVTEITVPASLAQSTWNSLSSYNLNKEFSQRCAPPAVVSYFSSARSVRWDALFTTALATLAALALIRN